MPRVLVWFVLLAFLAACTKDVVRGPMDTGRYTVDLERLGARRVLLDGPEMHGLEILSLVLTPAQWPLEASFKNLFQGDFVGTIENFDLSFRASRLRNDTLERLFGEGYLPAFLKVSNRSTGEVSFNPDLLVVLADKGTSFYPVSADVLPERFKEIDWAQTGLNVVLVALVVVLIVASAKEGRSGGHGILRAPNTNFFISGGGGRSRRGRRGYSKVAQPSDKGLLRARLLKPGETIEGFVFFQLDRTVADWSSARVEILP